MALPSFSLFFLVLPRWHIWVFLKHYLRPAVKAVSLITFPALRSLRDVYNNLGTLRDMIKVVNGKMVVLIKATDELHSKVAGLTKYLKTIN